ncbi:hypothetical protein IDG15_003842 [Salmonella enterica subsp. enterica serovar Enteritidis]|nr:hypothetical protein [Salmonella enterica subsp. enterica serovar Enteritidis]
MAKANKKPVVIETPGAESVTTETETGQGVALETMLEQADGTSSEQLAATETPPTSGSDQISTTTSTTEGAGNSDPSSPIDDLITLLNSMSDEQKTAFRAAIGVNESRQAATVATDLATLTAQAAAQLLGATRKGEPATAPQPMTLGKDGWVVE